MLISNNLNRIIDVKWLPEEIKWYDEKIKEKEKIEEKKQRLRYIGRSFFVLNNFHIGKKIIKRNTDIVRTYVQFYDVDRQIYNINVIIIELRKMLKMIEIQSKEKGGLIVNIPIRKFLKNMKKEKDLEEIDVLIGERNTDIFYLKDRFKIYSKNRFCIITRWFGGILSNYTYFKNKVLLSSTMGVKKLNKQEQMIAQLVNIIVPKIFIGFHEDFMPINEAVSLNLNSFLFIDSDFNGKFEKHDTVRIIALNLSINVVCIIISLLSKSIYKNNIENMMYAEKDVSLQYVWKYRYNYIFEPETIKSLKSDKIFYERYNSFKAYRVADVRKTK